jgi:hypothetical protein
MVVAWMFAILLGTAWLVLSPFCIWWIFGRGLPRSRRLIAILILGGLEAATLTMAVNERRQSGTAMPMPVAPAPSHASLVPPRVAPAVPRVAKGCDARLPVPERVRLSRGAGGVSGLAIYWKASSGECAAATLTLRRKGRMIRLWVREGDPRGRHRRTVTLPVHVAGHTASLDTRISPPLPGHGRYVAVDGRSGRAIPEKTVPEKTVREKSVTATAG